MLRFAMISKWHAHSEGYANFIKAQPDCQITCVWDEEPERGKEWAEELGVDFEPCYDKLLERNDVDAICVVCPTNMHPEIMIKAANAKKHIFTEKVLALTAAEADEIIEAIEKNGVKFSICYPHRCLPRNLFVKKAIEDGLLGDISVLRIRNVHSGASDHWQPEYWYNPVTTGGGAMMDLGAHGMYMAHWLLGNPVRIQSMFNNLIDLPIEDNAVCTIEFENKAVAITETSFVSPLVPFMIEVYGTKGAIIGVGDDIKICTKDTAKIGANGGWIKAQLPKNELPHPIRQFIDAVVDGKEILFGTKEARMLSLLMEKAYISHKERREVKF